LTKEWAFWGFGSTSYSLSLPWEDRESRMSEALWGQVSVVRVGRHGTLWLQSLFFLFQTLDGEQLSNLATK
jgi:hypothetical protein